MKLRELVSLLEAVRKQNNISPIYFCGGLVRDKIRGAVGSIDDIDITTGDETVHSLARSVAIELGKTYQVKTNTMDDGHTSLRIGNTKLDFSSNFKAPNIDRILNNSGIAKPTKLQEEMFSRDFTCNALLMKLDLTTISDPTHKGIADINQKILRTCLSPERTFGVNTNRIVRAIYLSAKLGFEIAPEIKKWISQNKQLIQKSNAGYVVKTLEKGMKFDEKRVKMLMNEMGLWKVVPALSDRNSVMINPIKRNLDYGER